MTAIYPVLGQISPTNTAETTLYVAPTGKYAISSTLFLSNITHLGTPADIAVTVRIRPAGAAAANKHIVSPAVRIRPNQALTLTVGVTLAATDVISVQSSVANGLAATLCGTELP